MLQGFCFSNKVYIFAVLKEIRTQRGLQEQKDIVLVSTRGEPLRNNVLKRKCGQMGDVVNVRVTFGWLRWFKSTLTNY